MPQEDLQSYFRLIFDKLYSFHFIRDNAFKKNHKFNFPAKLCVIKKSPRKQIVAYEKIYKIASSFFRIELTVFHLNIETSIDKSKIEVTSQMILVKEITSNFNYE